LEVQIQVRLESIRATSEVPADASLIALKGQRNVFSGHFVTHGGVILIGEGVSET